MILLEKETEAISKQGASKSATGGSPIDVVENYVPVFPCEFKHARSSGTETPADRGNYVPLPFITAACDYLTVLLCRFLSFVRFSS